MKDSYYQTLHWEAAAKVAGVAINHYSACCNLPCQAAEDCGWAAAPDTDKSRMYANNLEKTEQLLQFPCSSTFIFSSSSYTTEVKLMFWLCRKLLQCSGLWICPWYMWQLTLVRRHTSITLCKEWIYLPILDEQSKQLELWLPDKGFLRTNGAKLLYKRSQTISILSKSRNVYISLFLLYQKLGIVLFCSIFIRKYLIILFMPTSETINELPQTWFKLEVWNS